MGQPLVETHIDEGVVSTVISAPALAAHRERFPAMLDGDRFTIE
jgi:hypothetical protein